jgi:hypothetical protein
VTHGDQGVAFKNETLTGKPNHWDRNIESSSRRKKRAGLAAL